MLVGILKINILLPLHQHDSRGKSPFISLDIAQNQAILVK
jgi:hypothetical protein